MSDIPVPRSYNQIVGEMVDALISRLGLKSIYVGSAVLSIIEAAAQSDLRSSQDLFEFLNSHGLDRATGTALARIGADEGLQQFSPAAATGNVTIGDSSFNKIATIIYQGAAAPIIGSTTISVENAADFPASGNIYLGRGTGNYEGPIAYTAKTNIGNYWNLTLATGTTRFHNLAETVVLGQGGNRTIPAGTAISTAQGTLGVSQSVSTLFEAVLLDGEKELANIPVVASEPGSTSNVPAAGLVRFVSPPFATATVTNPLPLGGGRDTETVEQFRERIRAARASRTKGTALAIEQGVLGAIASDEKKRIVSSALVVQEGEPATLYIDDGQGYEEQTEGIAFEVLVDSATGGERYFSLQNRAIPKAFVTSQTTSPFTLTDFSTLTVLVGGLSSTHQFSAGEFGDISGASAFEVVTSINANPALLFSARTSDDGTRVVLFAKNETDEEIQVLGGSANTQLQFSTDPNKTLWLYKDDVLLNKDGRPAILATKQQFAWPSLVSGAGLVIEVDKIPVSITVTDSDFVNLTTGFTSVSNSNSLASWAAVLNSKIPGVTVTVQDGTLRLVSNKGASSLASLKIVSGTLASIFSDTLATGLNKDYTLDRNLGQIKLETSLLAGERLTAASFATRSFVQTPEFTTKTVSAASTSATGESGAELWAIVDASVEIIPTFVGTGSSIQVLDAATESWGRRVRYQSTSNLFSNVAVGDLVFAVDSAFALNNRGCFRVVRVDPTWVEVERATGSFTAETVSLAFGGLTFARPSGFPQRVYLPAASSPYTPSSLVAQINTQLRGATATVYRTRRARVRTNTFGGGGYFSFVAANSQGALVGFPIAANKVSGVAHLATKLSAKETAWPLFYPLRVSSPVSATSFNFTSLAGIDGVLESGSSVVAVQTIDTSASLATAASRRWGQAGYLSSINNRNAGAAVLRTPLQASSSWLTGDRFYQVSNFVLSARDSLGVVANRDQASGRFVLPTYRRLKPTTNTYGTTNTFVDSDNGNQGLGLAFGGSFDWTDFAVHMKSRVNAGGILWRYYRHGEEGNYARLAYEYPIAANSAVSIRTVNPTTNSQFQTYISLESGAARNTSFRPTARVGSALIAANTRADVFSLVVASGSRIIRLDYSSGTGARTGLCTGVSSGATGTVVTDGGTFVQLTGVTGTFQNGENLTFGGGGSAVAVGNQYGFTTLTLTLPATTPAITNHGLVAGNIVWLQSTDPNFVTGPKTLTASTATTVSYRDSAIITGAIAGSLTISGDTGGEATLAGSGYVVGDIWSRDTGPVINIGYKTRTIVDRHLTYNTQETSPVSTTLTWSGLNSASLFPLGTNSTATIVAAVNAIATSPVSGTVITPGNIIWATFEPEALGFSTPLYSLSDGINYVRSQTFGANNYTFVFKDGVTAGLATNSDWINEEVRIVPVTTQNVVNYLSTQATSGLSGAAEILNAGTGTQITSSTIGSLGSINIEGGLANDTVADVIANSTTTGVANIVRVATSQAEGLTGGQFVWIQNRINAPKRIFTAATQVTVTSAGELTLGVDRAWKYPANGATGQFIGVNVKVEKHGNLAAYVFDNGTSIASSLVSGDWFVAGIENVDPVSPGTLGTLNSANRGVFRVVAAYTASFWGGGVVWVENSKAVEEIASGSFLIADEDSLLPGDTISIGTIGLGTNNQGVWTVSRIDRNDRQKVWLSTATKNPDSIGPITLGAMSTLVQAYGSSPIKMLGRIGSIAPVDSTTTQIKFTDLDLDLGVSIAKSYYATNKPHLISSTYGTFIQPLAKLGFDLTENSGRDGYSRYIGIISEANKVVYGFAQESSSYPGIAAAGAKININGPLLRRIKIALAVRPQTGVSLDGLVQQVQAGVAAYVQSVGVGEPVSIGEIVAAVQEIDGIVSVAVISPEYNVTSDIIPVQPYEKARVINPNEDIVVNLIGE